MQKDIEEIISFLQKAVFDLRKSGLLTENVLLKPTPPGESPINDAYMKMTGAIVALSILKYRTRDLEDFEKIFATDR